MLWEQSLKGLPLGREDLDVRIQMKLILHRGEESKSLKFSSQELAVDAAIFVVLHHCDV
jgi:hypothetical protein